MKWLVVFLIILTMLACDSNSDSIGADSNLGARMAALEKRVRVIEAEVSGYGTIPSWEMNSRIDQLDERVSRILRSLQDPRYPLPPGYGW